MRNADAIAAKLAQAQYGVFARWQLAPLGVSGSAIKRRIQSGTWLRKAPGVYGLPGLLASFEQRVWIGLLATGPDAIVSHHTAAQVHDIPNVVRGLVTLTVAHGWHHRIPNVVVHQLDDILPEHRTEVGGLPVTTIPRTIVDLAPLLSRARLLDVLEDSRRKRLVTYEAVGECLITVARPRKPGVRKLLLVLDELTHERAVSGSELERALLEVIDRHRLPRPRAQFPHPGRKFVLGCVDFAYVEAKLIVEADGRSWHTRINDLRRDHERDSDAAREGWQTQRLLYEEIVGDPDGSAQAIRDILQMRLSQLGR